MGWETITLLVSLFAITLKLAVPIALAALGEIFAERSGVLNLGVEGIMLMGAFTGFWAAYYTGYLWSGVLFGIITGGVMGLLMAFMSVTLRADQVVSGLGIYYLGWGLSYVLYRIAFGTSIVTPKVEGFGTIHIPVLSQIPIIGPILFQQNILVYLTIILIPVCAIVLFRSTFGLKIRATGEKPEAADTAGINVNRTRYLCVILGGVLAGLAGAYLTLALDKMFMENMTLGRGFIAIAIVYFGKWNPYRTFGGALLFGGAYSLQFWLQSAGVVIPYELLQMLPFILTIGVLTLVARKAYEPAALGIPYKRGEM